MPAAAQARLEFAVERAFRHLMYARDRAIDCGDEHLADDLLYMATTLVSISTELLENRKHKREFPLNAD